MNEGDGLIRILMICQAEVDVDS